MNSFKNWNTQANSKSARENSNLSDSKNLKQLDQSQQIRSEVRDNDMTITKKNKSLFGRSMNEYDPSYDRDSELRKTSCKLMTTNFNHHDPELCVCDSCSCGRHLCKFHNVKPDLSKSSVYKQSYPKKSPVPNLINISGEYSKLQGPHIGMDSNYNKDFIKRGSDKTERPRPQDLLKSGGPCNNLTSYSSGFPGFMGENQYVKPTDNHVRADFPMRAKSTYAKSFQNRTVPKPITEKIPDNLKTSNLWMGKTTYGNFFNQPNPQSYPSKVKNIQKLQINPRFARQYETTYGNSFVPQKQTVCPAKVILEGSIKGGLNSTKGRFNQNSDFKSLNPAFHSISTSKHCYV